MKMCCQEQDYLIETGDQTAYNKKTDTKHTLDVRLLIEKNLTNSNY